MISKRLWIGTLVVASAVLAPEISLLTIRAAENEPRSPWALNFGVGIASMDKEIYSGNVHTTRTFDSKGAFSFDLFGTRRWASSVSSTFGASAVEFDGKSYTDSTGLGVVTTPIKAKSLYTGLILHTDEKAGFGGFCRVDVGAGFLESVKHAVSTSSGATQLGSERALMQGKTDPFFGVGFGVFGDLGNGWSARGGWTWRSYGKLDGNPATSRSLIVTHDIDVEVQSFEVGLTYRF